MLSVTRRQWLVVVLLLFTGLTSRGLEQPSSRPLVLPAISTLGAESGWHAVTAYQPSGWGMVYRQWLLADAHGRQAWLYVGVTSQVKTMLSWSGELGYKGEGYIVVDHGEQPIRLHNGTVATVSTATVQRLADRRFLAYAVVSADGIAAHGTDHLLRTLWEVLRGARGPYYLVRVSVPASMGDATARVVAERLLAPVLSVLQTHVH